MLLSLVLMLSSEISSSSSYTYTEYPPSLCKVSPAPLGGSSRLWGQPATFCKNNLGGLIKHEIRHGISFELTLLNQSLLSIRSEIRGNHHQLSSFSTFGLKAVSEIVEILDVRPLARSEPDILKTGCSLLRIDLRVARTRQNARFITLSSLLHLKFPFSVALPLVSSIVHDLESVSHS